MNISPYFGYQWGVAHSPFQSLLPPLPSTPVLDTDMENVNRQKGMQNNKLNKNVWFATNSYLKKNSKIFKVGKAMWWLEYNCILILACKHLNSAQTDKSLMSPLK